MMGGWLARLKNEKAPDTHAREPRQPQQGGGTAGFLGLLAYPQAPFQKIEADDLAMLTVATDATHGGMNAPTVARVATVASPEKTEAANDGELTVTVPDPDLWRWPHSVAWNSKEIETFTARLARFTDKGVSHDEAELLTDKLVIRDRVGDERRLCLECAHLQGWGRWRCGNWQAADVARQGLARDLVLQLTRCGGFAAQQGLIER